RSEPVRSSRLSRPSRAANSPDPDNSRRALNPSRRSSDNQPVAEVLVVDDDPDIRGMLAFTLMDSGYDVRQASDGEAALAALAERAPDCLVLDLMMPGVDGFGVLRAKRLRGLAPETRVMILTCKTG